jgi:hypothetical protein
MSDMLDIFRSAGSDAYWDIYLPIIQAVPDSRERKLAEAKAWLGSKWVLHPHNAVKRKNGHGSCR